jgi:hypothetical protein
MRYSKMSKGERVRGQEKARGWHRLSDAQPPLDSRLAVLSAIEDAKEYEHDRRLRGQYE